MEDSLYFLLSLHLIWILKSQDSDIAYHIATHHPLEPLQLMAQSYFGPHQIAAEKSDISLVNRCGFV